jgi:hypothetical protein
MRIYSCSTYPVYTFHIVQMVYFKQMRRVYNNNIFILLLFLSFLASRSTSTTTNSATSNKIVQYLKNRNSGNKPPSVNSKNNNNVASYTDVDANMHDLIKSLSSDLDTSKNMLKSRQNIKMVTAAEARHKELDKESKAEADTSMHQQPYQKQLQQEVSLPKKKQQQDDVQTHAVNKKNDKVLRQHNKRVQHDASMKSHRFLRIHTASKKSRAMLHGKNGNKAHSANKIKIPSPLELVQGRIDEIKAQGAAKIGELSGLLGQKVELFAQKVQPTLKNVKSQLGNIHPHELFNTEGFEPDVSKVAGGSTYSPSCEAMNANFDKECGSVTAHHRRRDECKYLTDQLMEQCWLAEQHGLLPLGDD